jgi:porin
LATDIFDADSPWMFGDWGGHRTGLEVTGVTFLADYVGESATNLNGAFDDDTVTRWADQFTFGLHLDLEKLLGWPTAQFRFAATGATAIASPPIVSATLAHRSSRRCRRFSVAVKPGG